MKKPIASALLSGTLLASILATPALAQESVELCNGLVPTIVGTDGDDVLRGTWKDDVILGLGGNDTIYGASGSDTICGGEGDDYINGNSQVDVIYGGAGNDTIYGEAQDDVIYGGAGNDTIYGGADEDEIDGGAGDDVIFGESQDDVIFGGAGNDDINGGPDEDTLDGGPGVDVVDGSWQDDSCANAETAISCETEFDGGNGDGTTTPVLLSEQEMNWSLGASEWVNLMWTADDDLANVSVELSDLSEGLEVTYPSNTTSSRLGVDADLSKSEIDFTAIKLTTTTAGVKYAIANISWDDATGERQTSQFKLSLSNKQYEGDDFAILTDAVTVGTNVDAPQQNWIDLDYKGLAPTNRDMKMTVTSELPVYHPQVDFTSLHHDEVLHAGETDAARVWFDPELIEAGEYSATVTIDYVNSEGIAKTVEHTVTVTVD